MTSYNVHQQVFRLLLASNYIGSVKGMEACLQAGIQATLPIILESIAVGWQVAWGLRVWKYDPEDGMTGPDNIWFVARNPAMTFEDGKTYNTYVVSMAGSTSLYDWLVENLSVGSVINFPTWVAEGLQNPPKEVQSVSNTGTYIAYSTAGGMNTLASQPAPLGAAGTGLSLPQFLASLASSNSKLVFTGHSLGGALLPTLALRLLLSQTLSQFDPTNVLVYPTAGPSPGNSPFSDLFNSTFPNTAGSDYQIWNCNIVNTYDIVPQAWCLDPFLSPQQNLENIPMIFGQPFLFKVVFAVSVAVVAAGSVGTIYIPIQSCFFASAPIALTPSDLSEFLVDAEKEHVPEYEKHLSIGSPNLELLICKGISYKTKEERYLYYPAISVVAQEGPKAPRNPC